MGCDHAVDRDIGVEKNIQHDVHKKKKKAQIKDEVHNH